MGKSLGVHAAGKWPGLIKPLLRRASYLLAPSDRPDLIRFVLDPLTAFGISRAEVEDALDELLTYGDILEMKRLASDAWDAPPYVLRPAPPSFVLRSDGSVVLLGVAAGLPTPLTSDLARHVEDRGPIRLLRTAPGDDLVGHLKLLGLMEVSEAAWLRTPTPEEAAAHFRRALSRLAEQQRQPQAVDDAEILDSSRPNHFYRGRWRALDQTTTGIFISRRSQLYGPKLWSLIEFENGVAHRVLDLHQDGERQRPCDIAWRLQAAIDASSGHPQSVRLREDGSQCHLEFSAPLPAFAERRLALIGQKVTGRPNSLFSFAIARDQVSTELRALQELLWMTDLRAGGTQ